jgi:hypothetical protein
MTENLFDSPAFLRDMQNAITQGKIEITDDGRMLIPSAGVSAGGVFTSGVKRHELVQRAIDAGDPEQELWAREKTLLVPDSRFELGFAQHHNLVPTLGLNLLLNQLFRNRAAIATWYYGPFLTSWTPAPTAGSNWAGASGALATELSVAQMVTQTTRKAATFGVDAANASITTTAFSEVTLAAGVSGLIWYGLTLNEASAVAYNATDKLLLSASKRPTPLSGLGAGDAFVMGYEFSATST